MTSTLYVDNLEPNLGNRVMAAGHVVQVVQEYFNTETSTTSTSYIDSSLSASITPASTSSKILITLDVPVRSNNSGVSMRIQHSVDGGSTWSNTVFSRVANAHSYISGGPYAAWNNTTKVILHSPTTTSQITYKMQWYRAGSGTAAIICDSSDPATLTLMEIAQ